MSTGAPEASGAPVGANTGATNVSELLEWIERFETARDQLDEKIREAHAATKACRQAKDELDARRLEILKEMADTVTERAADFVDTALDHLTPELKNYMDRTGRRIMSQFQQLEDAIFYGSTGIDVRKRAKELIDQSQGADPSLPNIQRGNRITDSKGNLRKNRRK
jgi:exonuclease VII small subunit